LEATYINKDSKDISDKTDIHLDACSNHKCERNFFIRYVSM